MYSSPVKQSTTLMLPKAEPRSCSAAVPPARQCRSYRKYLGSSTAAAMTRRGSSTCVANMAVTRQLAIERCQTHKPDRGALLEVLC